MNKKIIIIVVILIAAAVFLYMGNMMQEPLASEQVNLDNQAKQVFGSQEACEKETGGQCVFQNCDYIPDGKTFDEVCGKDFKKGWVVSTTSNK